jgi:hypothetical protein
MNAKRKAMGRPSLYQLLNNLIHPLSLPELKGAATSRAESGEVAKPRQVS